MPENKAISALDTLANSGDPILMEAVRSGDNFKFKLNLQASVAPTVTNDSSQGYSVGSIWMVGSTIYIATDVSVGAAVWKLANQTYALETITPVVTSSSGSADDFNVTFFKQGNLNVAHGLCRAYIVADGENETVIQLTIPAAFAPAANFTGSFQAYGGASASQLVNATGQVVTCILSSVSGAKKLEISVVLAANAVTDFETSLWFTATWLD